MASWDNLGEISNIAQLTGLDAVRLISMIVKAASTARMHKSNCRRFAHHLKLIGGLLEQLRVSELKKYPETREPLEQLEDALRRGYLLVNSCQDRSYLYLLAMGWNIVYQFRKAQNEIDNYLRLVPLITLVDNARVRERIEYIERDQCEYSFDEEDKEVQDVLLNPDPNTNPSIVLKKTLSCSYPNLPFNEALRKESEKLQVELQRSQSNMDIGQCEVIHHLLGVTRTVASSIPEESTNAKVSKKTDSNYTKANEDSSKSYDDGCPKKEKDVSNAPRSSSPVTYRHDLVSDRGSQSDEWHTDLLGCCSEPSLFYAVGYSSASMSRQYNLNTILKSRHGIQLTSNSPVLGRYQSTDLLFSLWHILKDCFNRQEQAHVNSLLSASAEACNDIMAYSLILSCCCYTCCVRRKLRQKLNIAGGCCDDFLSHLMCCCCALVQEWREVEIRGAYGEKTKVTPPPCQYMEH